MLKSLAIRNFAVIESLDLEFEGGFTVFTGETGAGKSILIEALGFLLGERGTVDWLRSDSKQLEVSAVFDDPDSSGTLTLQRGLDARGRSRAARDGSPITLDALSRLGERLVDFHGQHEHQNLLRPESQMLYLDAYAQLGEEAAQTAGAYREWKDAESARDALELSEEERLRRIDLLRFQIGEIDGVAPRPGEEEGLAESLPRLKNAERLRELAHRAYQELYGREGSAEESLREAEVCLGKMAELDASLSESLAALGRAREGASDVAAALAQYREAAGTDPQALDALIGRQDKLSRLKKKYGQDIEAVLGFRTRADRELSDLEDHKTRLRSAEQKCEGLEIQIRGLCGGMHEKRVGAARRLSKKVVAQLKELGMPSVRLSVSVEMEEGLLTERGSDRVEFLIAPNPGEPLKTLRATASGGELSRVMLGLKTVLSAQDNVGLMVFDEVDTGVGAAVGRSVGRKLAELSVSRQIFCVTHLAQVACCAKTHFQVVKSVSAGRTFTHVERLSQDRRVEAIARMLGGRKTTAASRRHAQEMMTAA